MILEEIRCPKCGRKLFKLNGQAEMPCPRCKTLLYIDTEARKVIIIHERQKSAN